MVAAKRNSTVGEVSKWKLIEDVQASAPASDKDQSRTASKDKTQSARRSGRKGTPLEAAIPAKGAGEVFDSAALNDQLREFCQLVLHDRVSTSLESRWQSLLSNSFEFIPNDAFALKGASRSILDEQLLFSLELDKSIPRSPRLADLPPHLARLCETKLLTAEQERDLFRRMNFLLYCAEKLRSKSIESEPSEARYLTIHGLLRAANWHRDMIVKSNMRLVISIIKKFANANNHFDDLLSDGIMALIRAVEKFDFDLGFRFSTYATQVVRRNAYRNVMTKQKERLKMGRSLEDINVDFDDRAAASGISPDRWNLLRNKLTGLLQRLDRRERLIVRARFSLGSHRKVQTLQRIADCLGVSKERVRQLENRALEKLRALAGLDELPEFVST